MKMTARFKITMMTMALLLSSVHPSAWAHQQAFENMGISKPRTEKSAPGFSLQDTKGNRVKLEDFHGKPILLNFWATWCEACKEELPSMQRLYEAASSQGVEVVAIAIDRRNFDRVKKYAEEYKLTFPVLWDPEQKVRKHYYIMGLPTTYLIGPKGKLKGFASGARVWDSPDSMQALISLKE